MGCPGAAVTGSSEPLSVGAGDRTQVPGMMSSKYS